jgi:hypothetical protein
MLRRIRQKTTTCTVRTILKHTDFWIELALGRHRIPRQDSKPGPPHGADEKALEKAPIPSLRTVTKSSLRAEHCLDPWFGGIFCGATYRGELLVTELCAGSLLRR